MLFVHIHIRVYTNQYLDLMDTRQRVKTHAADQLGGKHGDMVQKATLY